MRDDDVLAKNPLVSQSALEAIHDQVFGWALSRCDYDRHVAEDLVQQTYVQLLSGKAKFEQRSTLKTFVFSVVQNLAKSRYRRQASRLRVLSNVRDREVEEYAEVSCPTEYSELWRAVQGLPQRQRDIIELVFCRELTVDDASAVMGVTTGTGRVHYDRAKKTLRARLQGQQDAIHE